MILSAADIKDLIGSDPLLKLLARVKIVDNKPPAEAGTGAVIYINRYPQELEFEVSWKIWIVDFDGEPIDIIVRQLRKLLPKVSVSNSGIVTELSTTEIKTVNTQLKPSEAAVSDASALEFLNRKFEELAENIEDRMLLVGPGRAGRDGRDGRDGTDGRDGRDISATDTELGELKDVETSEAKAGQFLMFDGISWVSRFVPQVFKYAGGGGGGGIEEAPEDGNYYVRKDGAWVELRTAINDLNLDGGNFNS